LVTSKNEALVSRITSKYSNEDSGSNKKAAKKVKVKDTSQILKASVGAKVRIRSFEIPTSHVTFTIPITKQFPHRDCTVHGDVWVHIQPF